MPSTATLKSLVSGLKKYLSRNPSFVIKIGVILIILLGLGLYLWWYSSQDHSIYSKLKTENYNGQNFLNISFKYPSIMTFNSTLVHELNKTNTPLVYSYKISSTQNVFIAVTYLPILKNLNLSPSQLLYQIKNDTGDYIDLLSREGTNRYSGLYGDCENYITNTDNQTGLLCTTSSGGLVTTRVVGVTNVNQYIFLLVMPSKVWTAHQQVWQKIEKSFVY